MPDPPTVKPTGFSCAACGYNLSGTTIGGICPECGVLVEHSLRKATSAPRTSGHATTSLVLGILSLVVCALIGPVAIAFAAAALHQVGGGGYTPGSRGMAIAGLVLGILSSILLAGFFGLTLLGNL